MVVKASNFRRGEEESVAYPLEFNGNECSNESFNTAESTKENFFNLREKNILNENWKLQQPSEKSALFLKFILKFFWVSVL